MAKHNQTGAKGEQIAEEFLANKGYLLLARNWRFGHKEVDLIMRNNDWLVIVEVKTRKGFGFGFPEEAVTPAKQQFLQLAAQAYFDRQEGFEKVRFDVVSILLDDQEKVVELLHLEDAF